MPSRPRQAPEPPFPADEEVKSEARRLAAADLGRDLHTIDDILAEQGHRGPDGYPYPISTMSNLLDDDLKRRRVEYGQEAMRKAAADYNRWLRETWILPEWCEELRVVHAPVGDAPGPSAPVKYADFDECAAAVALLYPGAGTAAEVREDLDAAARALLWVVGPESVLVRGCQVSRTECSDCILVRASVQPKPISYALKKMSS